jgi:tRNA(adenine34) deaminase
VRIRHSGGPDWKGCLWSSIAIDGGHSRWNILSDTNLSTVLPEVFLPAPEIVSGFLQDEVVGVFHRWNPLIWQVIKARGVFVGNAGENS